MGIHKNVFFDQIKVLKSFSHSIQFKKRYSNLLISHLGVGLGVQVGVSFSPLFKATWPYFFWT